MSTPTETNQPNSYIYLVRSNANFRNLWLGQIVSLLGDWFNLIASASLVAMLTQSGVVVGGLFVVRMLAFGAALGDIAAGEWGVYPSFIIDSLTFLGSALLISRVVYQHRSSLAASDKGAAGSLPPSLLFSP